MYKEQSINLDIISFMYIYIILKDEGPKHIDVIYEYDLSYIFG